LVEDLLHELRLDLDPLRGDTVVRLDRADDGSVACRPVEMLEPKAIRKQVRDLRLEDVEHRERLFAKREQAVNSQPRPRHELRKLLQERALRRSRPVIDGVLLELVEDEV